MHLGLYLSCIFLLPLPFALWKYLATRTTSYQLTADRLICQQGVFYRSQDEVELYRIKDYTIVAPLLYRWLGLANLVLITSDHSHPELVLKGIPMLTVSKNSSERKLSSYERRRVSERLTSLFSLTTN